MEQTEKIAILREQIAALRSDIVRYSESQRTIARYAIIGVAAVIALRKDLKIADFEAFLPIVPIIAMGMFAIMILENVFIFRTGRWLAAAEKQLNAIAGEQFLQYDQSLRTWRSVWLLYGTIPVSIFLISATATYFWSFIYFLSRSDLKQSQSIVVLLWALAIIAYVFALLYFLRMLGELRAGVPVLPPAPQDPDPLLGHLLKKQ